MYNISHEHTAFAYIIYFLFLKDGYLLFLFFFILLRITYSRLSDSALPVLIDTLSAFYMRQSYYGPVDELVFLN